MATAEKPVLSKYKDRMDKAVAALKDEFASLRTGRASANLPEPRMISVNVWDRGLVVSVEKAIRNSGLGLNPVVDGQNLRIPIPPLTEERRKEIAKVAGKYAEQQRVAIRNIRRDANDDLKKAEKDGAINQDERKRMETEVQKLTDEAI